MMREAKVKRNGKIVGFVVILGMLVLFYIAATATKFNLIKALKAFPESFVWMSKNFVIDEATMKKLPNIMEKLKTTILMSISSTTIAGMIAFLLALLGSKTTRIDPITMVISRGIASFFRNVPEVVWSIIFLFTFSQSTMTGFLALFFVTLGMLTRAFIETIDEAAVKSIEGLKSVGAGYWKMIFQAIIPDSMPQFISWILYMIETNIRSATLIGILTGTGIGHIFNLYYKSLNYKACALVVIVTVIAVFIIEGISNLIRRLIL